MMNEQVVYRDGACSRCCGGGRDVNDEATGRNLKKLRESLFITAVQVATKMGISAAMVSQLERGKKGWNTELVTNYLAALNRPVQSMGVQ